MSERKPKPDAARRALIAKAAYVAPAILTLQAASAYAKSGSTKSVPPEDVPKGPGTRGPRF